MLYLITLIFYYIIIALWAIVPVAHLPEEVSSALGTIGSYVPYMNQWFPVNTLFQIMGVTIIISGLFVTWYCVQWVIKRVTHSG